MLNGPRFLLFTAAVLVSFGAGCGSPSGKNAAPGASAAQDYASAYKALMVSYRGQIGELTSRPLPPKSLPKDEKRAALAQQVDDVADADRGFVNRLDALHPPPSFQETHRSTRSFFVVSADDTHRWAEAIRHGDRAARVRAEHQLDTDSLTSLTHMQSALKRAGGLAQAKEMQGDINQIKQGMAK